MIVKTQATAHQKALHALKQHQFFKLIGGGSLTDAEVVARLTRVYAEADIDCVDVAPEPAVVNAIAEVYKVLPENAHKPLVMVSIPLDPDPHFRKIDLIEPQCIVCDACVPVCPTDALINTGKIEINEPLCYGCGRCVEVCPTTALVLHPFLQEEEIATVLGHPLVEAVEIHSQFVDPYMLDDFLARYGDLLKDKLIALCFRPDKIPAAQWIEFCRKLKSHLPGFHILQIDGQPMSGSDDPAASLPSLAAAQQVNVSLLEAPDLQDLFITLSGGINRHTADYLQNPQYAFVSGVGMGTVARRHVWAQLESDPQAAIDSAKSLVKAFKNQKHRL